MGSLAVYGRALDTRVRRPFRSSWLGGALLRRGSLCAPSATYIRAVRSLSLLYIFAFTKPRSARSGASAQRAARAAAHAKRTAAYSITTTTGRYLTYTILLGKNGVKWLWYRLLRDHGSLVYTGYQPIRTATPTKLPTRYRLGEPIAAYATRDTARFDSDQS